MSGVYESKTGGNSSQLKILQDTKNSFDFKLFVTSSNGNMGEIEGNSQLFDGIGKFHSKEKSCDLVFHFSEGKVVLSQTGYCGFGMNVDSTGEYSLVKN